MRAGSERRTPVMMIVTGALILAGSAVWPTAVTAQKHGGHYHGDRDSEYQDRFHDRTPRVQLGGGFMVAVPRGDFERFVGEGYGGQVHVVLGLDRSSVLALRFDAAYVNYGSERFTIPAFGTGLIGPEVRTRNNIAMFGVGPQLQVPRGPIRPFVNGFVGLGYFFTESSLSDGFLDFGSTLNYDDTSLAYGFGGGLGIELSRAIQLNLEAQYRRHEDVEYLTEGGIIDDGFGGVIVSPILSDADLLLFQVGVSFGL